MRHIFFSIIIPAYNEEKIIARTLECLRALEYPKEAYEVVVVENGSTDRTYEIAKQYESSTVAVYAAPEKGVSRARNFGARKCSSKVEWCIFMDADVFVKEQFLLELDAYLEAHPLVGYGTTTVYLDNSTRTSRMWSTINNFFFNLFKILFTVHIVKKELLSQVSYDEELTSGEDIQYGRALSNLGTYFFMSTDQVVTSDRRFQKKGHFSMFFINLYHGITHYIFPRSILKKIDWEPIR